MFIPYAVDAPIYHRPYATVGLLFVNVCAFFGLEEEVLYKLMLWWGVGLHPHQWVTSNFVHGSLDHLLGNMFFLWTFGILVEGKIGWWRFLLVYFGIGIVECAGEQAILLGYGYEESDELSREDLIEFELIDSSLGASSILYGLIAISLIWAPKNGVSFFWWFFVRGGTFQLTIQTSAILFLALDVLYVFLTWGLALATLLLHIAGALVGLPVGVLMVKRGWVDCEGWDWFSIRARRNIADPLGKHPGEVRSERPVPGSDEERGVYLDLLRDRLGGGDARKALEVYRNASRELGNWRLEEPELARLVEELFAAKAWNECFPLVQEYHSRFPRTKPGLHLRYATLLIQGRRRPAKGLEVLDSLSVDDLNTQEKALALRLRTRAQRLLDEGVLELDD